MKPSERALINLLLRGYESKDLDYKGPTQWDENNKKACCELIKDVMAMANTNGGFIVIGVSEAPNGFSWKGLSLDQLSTYDTTRFNRSLQKYTDPPINALLRKVEHDNKSFVVIEVPRFVDTPHVCQRDFPGVLTTPTLYVRTDNNESAPIRSSADFRALIEQATRNRADSLLTAMRSILTSRSNAGTQAPGVVAAEQFTRQYTEAVARFRKIDPLPSKRYEGYREASYFLEEFQKERFTIDELRLAAHRSSVSFTGWPFLFIHGNRPDLTSVIQDGLETLVSTEDFVGNDMVDFWRLQQSGFFYQRTLMPEDSQAQKQGSQRRIANSEVTAMYVAEAVLCLSNLYQGLLADEEDVMLRLRLLDTEKRILKSPRPLSGTYECRIPEIVVERRHSLADWRAGVVDHAVEITNDIYVRFNWTNPNLAMTRDVIEKLFARRW